MDGIFVWNKTNTAGEEFPLKAIIPSITDGMPERHGKLWFKSKMVLDKEYEDIRSRMSCNMDGWEDLFVRPISFVDDGKTLMALSEPILNVCTEFMGEKVYIWFDRHSTMTATQKDGTLIAEFNIVPFSSTPDDCEKHEGILGLDDRSNWPFYPIGDLEKAREADLCLH